MLSTTKQQVRKPAAILGNGPSLRGFDFASQLEPFATFGMNAAYRHWHAIGWYPNYYACLDEVLGLSHKNAIAALIEGAKENGIQRFLLRESLIRELGDLGANPCVVSLEALYLEAGHVFQSPRITTGSHTLLWAVSLGFRDVVLLGVDANYVEILPEAVSIGGARLEIQSTPQHNPNYFFDGYQQAGDRYHVPNPAKNKNDLVHVAAWESICPVLNSLNTVVVNASPESQVKPFVRCSYSEALSVLATERQRREEMEALCANIGDFSRERGVHMDELKVFYPFLPKQDGVLIDVGAHMGGSCLRFLRRGWQVYAFEPDPEIRTQLEQNTAQQPNIHIDSRAVSKVSGREYPWYATQESTGAGTMKAFCSTHRQVGTVHTVTLSDFIQERGITHVDLLKIDAEGFDYMALQGFPFQRLRPAHIICEYEDSKTLPLGSSTHDLASLLLQQGYSVFISEWHPILRYGIRHQWRRFLPYPAEQYHSASWGNLLAFATPPNMDTLLNAVKSTLQPGMALPSSEM